MPNIISQRIHDALNDFFQNANLQNFLTEDDLRCHLFCKINTELRNFNHASVHAEVRWYGDNREPGTNKLKYRSDLVVIDNRTLDNPTSKNFVVPSKGYGFHSYYAIVELKLRRPNNKESNEYYKKKIDSDIQKLRKISQNTSSDNNPVYWVILIDKKRSEKKAWVITDTLTELI